MLLKLMKMKIIKMKIIKRMYFNIRICNSYLRPGINIIHHYENSQLATSNQNIFKVERLENIIAELKFTIFEI